MSAVSMSTPLPAPRVTPGCSSGSGTRRGLLRAVLGLALIAAAVSSGCAAFNQVAVDVAGFGTWPAGRAPGRYALDRLPSQQAAAGAAADSRAAVEQAVRAALEGVGFQRAERAEEADVLVRADTRLARVVDPAFELGIGAGRGFGRVGIGVGMRYPFGGRFWGPDPVWEHREVELLLTDRRSQQVLYEARARLDGRVVMESLLKPMFDATLQGFPQLVAGERRVVIPLSAD